MKVGHLHHISLVVVDGMLHIIRLVPEWCTDMMYMCHDLGRTCSQSVPQLRCNQYWLNDLDVEEYHAL